MDFRLKQVIDVAAFAGMRAVHQIRDLTDLVFRTTPRKIKTLRLFRGTIVFELSR
jgi:hypothetical protein